MHINRFGSGGWLVCWCGRMTCHVTNLQMTESLMPTFSSDPTNKTNITSWESSMLWSNLNIAVLFFNVIFLVRLKKNIAMWHTAIMRVCGIGRVNEEMLPKQQKYPSKICIFLWTNVANPNCDIPHPLPASRGSFFPNWSINKCHIPMAPCFLWYIYRGRCVTLDIFIFHMKGKWPRQSLRNHWKPHQHHKWGGAAVSSFSTPPPPPPLWG